MNVSAGRDVNHADAATQKKQRKKSLDGHKTGTYFFLSMFGMSLLSAFSTIT